MIELMNGTVAARFADDRMEMLETFESATTGAEVLEVLDRLAVICSD